MRRFLFVSLLLIAVTAWSSGSLTFYFDNKEIPQDFIQKNGKLYVELESFAKSSKLKLIVNRQTGIVDVLATPPHPVASQPDGAMGAPFLKANYSAPAQSNVAANQASNFFVVKGEVSLSQPDGSAVPLANQDVLLVSRHNDRWYAKTSIQGQYSFGSIPRGELEDYWVILVTRVSKITGTECAGTVYLRPGYYYFTSVGYTESSCHPTLVPVNLSWHFHVPVADGIDQYQADLYSQNLDASYNHKTVPSLGAGGGWDR